MSTSLNLKGSVMNIIGSLGGKKFLAALGTLVSIVLVSKFGLSDEMAHTIINALMTIGGGFIGMQGVSDIATGGVTSSSTLPVDLVEMKKVAHAIECEKTKQITAANTTTLVSEKTTTELKQPPGVVTIETEDAISKAINADSRN